MNITIMEFEEKFSFLRCQSEKRNVQSFKRRKDYVDISESHSPIGHCNFFGYRVSNTQ